MTDRPAPRQPRANPAPRRALPRVTPLGAGGSLPDSLPNDLPVPDEHEAQVEQPTGRDLLIPNGSDVRRKGRGTATVPTLAELMPPPEQPRKKSHRDLTVGQTGEPAAEPRREHHKAGRDSKAEKDHKHGSDHKSGADHKSGKDSKDGKEPKAKEAALEVTLSKGLRKRLKAKCAEMGLTPEDAVAQLVEVWVDG